MTRVRPLCLVVLVFACSRPPPPAPPAPTPTPTPAATPAPPAPLPGSIDLATYCHQVADKSAAEWVRLEDHELDDLAPGRCVLPWADQPSKVFRPYSEAEGWVDLDRLRIAESECIGDTPGAIQEAAMMAPKALWIRIPEGAAGRILKISARDMRAGEDDKPAGWDNWRELHYGEIGDQRVFELPMDQVLGQARATVELEVVIEGTTATETALIHWPTRC